MDLQEEDLLACLTPSYLRLILMPTEACNLRCVYCWEEFSRGRMEPWVVAAVKRLLDHRADDLTVLALDWFGGEPLLALDIVEEVQMHALERSRERSDLALRTWMTTNGVLLDSRRLRRLLECEVRRFQIAFDGPPEVHDRKRVTAGGGATFQRIWANLLAARNLESDLRIIVRLQVENENLQTIESFLDLFARDLGRDPRFELKIVPLSCFEPSLPVDARRSPVTAKATTQRARDRGLRLSPNSPGPPICHAATANSFMVLSDGTLVKCPVALYRPENRVGRLEADGRVEIDKEQMLGWMRGLESGDDLELRCPMQGWADGSGSEPSDKLRRLDHIGTLGS